MAALPSLRATASLGELRLGTLEVENVALLHTLLQLEGIGRIRSNGLLKPRCAPLCSAPPLGAHAGCVNGLAMGECALRVGFEPFCIS
eukprot:scaffold64083_cov71-Phaeocystis_antarctica.AAC.2